MANLVDWGLHWQRKGELEKVVDQRVRVAGMYGEMVARCLADRPAMEDVV
jgi:hypothetical protein